MARAGRASTAAPAVVLPGGFAYGDYLRAGVIARFSPVMRAVAAFAAEGGLVLGICNGFQVLAEAGLVPGALLRNRGLRFLGRDVAIVAERLDTPFTSLVGEPAAAADADRARRGLLLRRRRDARRSSSATARSSSATSTRTARAAGDRGRPGEPERQSCGRSPA